jgi:hypothetical protein
VERDTETPAVSGEGKPPERRARFTASPSGRYWQPEPEYKSVNPYRLIALVIIALFALGYARLLIDTGVRDEEPDEEPIDFYARAACTAIGDPVAELFGLEWRRSAKSASFGTVSPGCMLASPLPEEYSTEQVRVAVERIFIAARWEARARPPGFDLAYDRRPVTCAVRTDHEGIVIHCASRG